MAPAEAVNNQHPTALFACPVSSRMPGVHGRSRFSKQTLLLGRMLTVRVSPHILTLTVYCRSAGSSERTAALGDVRSDLLGITRPEDNLPRRSPLTYIISLMSTFSRARTLLVA